MHAEGRSADSLQELLLALHDERRSEDSLQEPLLAFHQMGSGPEAQASRLARHFHLLSHLHTVQFKFILFCHSNKLQVVTQEHYL